MHDTAGAPTDLVAPVAGRFLVTAAVGFAEISISPAGLRELLILDCGGPAASCAGALVSGAGIFGQVLRNATGAGAVQESLMSTSAILDLAAGDVVRVVVTQGSGGSLNLYPRAQAQMQKLN